MSKKSRVIDPEVQIDRRRNKDRRNVTVTSSETAIETQTTRRKQPRRRQIDPTTCEREYTDSEIQFMHAIDAYKRSSGRMFPTCSEILEVIRDLGYIQLTVDERAILQSIKEVETDASSVLSTSSTEFNRISTGSLPCETKCK